MLYKILFAIIWFGLLVISYRLCIFVSASMGPAVVAYITDFRPGKNTTATVTFFSLAGLSIPVMKFMNEGNPLALPDSLNLLLLVYLFAGMGYFIVWLVPKITVIIVDYKHESRAIRIREKIAQLIEEWGTEIKK
jgi:hypothetical protein